MATILINGVYHTSFRAGGGGAAGMDILELSTATGTLTSAQLALVQSDHCIIKYSNNYYHKSYHSTNGCDYVRGTFTKTNASVTDYYFTCDFSNSEFTFGSNADERARVVANPTLGSGESATPLQNIRVAGTAYSIPAISTDVLADKTSNTKTASPKAVYDAVMALAGNESYVTAWDGESAPVAANIPAGVTVTYSGQTTTGSLAASENTDGKIYLVSDTNGNFYRYITQLNGSTYSWVLRGTTELDLSDYATKEEVSQLDQKVGESTTVSSRRDINPGTATGSIYVRSDNGTTATSSVNSVFTKVDISAYAGRTLHYSRVQIPSASGYQGMAFYKSDQSYLSGVKGVLNASEWGISADTVVVPDNAVYASFTCPTADTENFELYVMDEEEVYTSGLGKDVADLQDDVADLQDDVADLQGKAEVGEVAYSKNMYNKNDPDIVDGKYLSASDGTPKNSNQNYMTSGYMPCEVGQTYCFQKNHEATNVYFICYYDKDKVYTNDSINGVNGTPFKTWTVPSGTLGTPAYFRISFQTGYPSTTMVEKGSTISDYVPYEKAVITYDYRTAIRAVLNKRELIILGDSSMHKDYWPSLLDSLRQSVGLDFTLTNKSKSGVSWNSAEDSPLDQWNSIKSGVGDTPVIIIGAGGVSITSYQLGYDATFARCFDDTSGMESGTDCAIETIKTILKDRPAARIFIQNNWMYQANDLADAQKRLKLAEMNRALCDYFGCVYVDVARGGNIHGYTENMQVDGSYPYRVFTADGVHVSTEVGKRYIFNLWLGYFMLYLADYAIHTITLPSGS